MMGGLLQYVTAILIVLTIQIGTCILPVHAAGGGCSFQCPRPGDPADFTVCCTSNGVSKCCSYKLLAGILGGVFGALILIGLIILVVCCVKIKRGDWVCVKVGPSRRTMMTRAKLQKYQQQQQLRNQQRLQMTNQISRLQDTQVSQQQQIEQQQQHIQHLEQQQNYGTSPPPDYSAATEHKY